VLTTCTTGAGAELVAGGGVEDVAGDVDVAKVVGVVDGAAEVGVSLEVGGSAGTIVTPVETGLP
jgi:hypothetical protein